MLKEGSSRFRLDRHLRTIYKKYERFLIPSFLVSGFVLDVVTFRTLQIITTLWLQLGYAALAGVAICFTHVFDARPHLTSSKILSYLRFLAPLAEQVAIGALLSSALLFYWFSGAFSVSWPLFAIISGVMVSSELFRHVYMRPTVQLSVLNFCLLSYFSILLPIVLKSLNGWVFILSGTLSTLLVLLIVFILGFLAPKLRALRPKLLVAVLMVYLIMSGFYFLKLIPPLPLAIKDAGIYHEVTRTESGKYKLVGEPESTWQGLWPGQTVHLNSGDPLYAFTAIFVPAELSTVIYHHWEYKNPATGDWTDQGMLHFVAKGGRQAGFRGYTLKSNLTAGRWRVTVQNHRGQVLGRLNFKIVAN